MEKNISCFLFVLSATPKLGETAKVYRIDRKMQMMLMLGKQAKGI